MRVVIVVLLTFCVAIIVSKLFHRAIVKGLYDTLLLLIRTLHGCYLLENAEATSPDLSLSIINDLPLAFELSLNDYFHIRIAIIHRYKILHVKHVIILLF